MPTASDFFPSKFLKAEDLDADLTVTIKLVTTDTVGQGAQQETKPVAHFVEVDKGLALNKTNFNAIAKITGEPNSDKWNGQKITLTVQDVEFKGDIVSAIRVKASTSDPLIQQYWQTVANFQMTQQEGRDHLKEFKGDFAKALAALQGEEETTPQPSEEFPF
jgi:hypothetical protein